VIPIVLLARVLIGDPLPAIALDTVDRGRLELPVKERIVVVDFFATWCGPCRESLPVLERLRARYGDRALFVSISEDEGEDARKRVARFAEAIGLHGPIGLDPDRAVFQRLGVRKLPTTYIVDGTGTVRHINNGYGPGYEARMARWLDGVLGGQKASRGVSAPASPSVNH